MSINLSEKSALLNRPASYSIEIRDSCSDLSNNLTSSVLVVIKRLPILETCERQSIRYTAIGTAGLASLVGKVFYIPINLRMPLGPAFAVGNLVSFAILQFWAARSFINDTLGTKSESKLRLLQEKSTNNTQRLSLGSIAITVAGVSQVPFALAAAYYNPDYKIAAATVTLISGSFFPAKSIYMSLSTLLNKKIENELDREIQNLQRELISLILSFREHFSSLEASERTNYINSLKAIRLIEDKQLLLCNYLDKCINFSAKPLPKYGIIRKTGEKVASTAGAILTVTLPVGLGLYTYSLTQTFIYDNLYFSAVSGIIVAGSYAYTSRTSIYNTVKRTYNSAIDLFKNKRRKSYAEKINPKLTFAFRSIGLLFNVFSVGATIVIWGDYFKDSPALKGYFQSTMSASIFLLVFTAMLDTVDDIVETIIRSNDNDLKSEWLKLDFELLELSKLLELASPIEFNRFLPEKVRKTLLTRIDSSRRSFQ